MKISNSDRNSLQHFLNLLKQKHLSFSEHLWISGKCLYNPRTQDLYFLYVLYILPQSTHCIPQQLEEYFKSLQLAESFSPWHWTERNKNRPWHILLKPKYPPCFPTHPPAHRRLINLFSANIMWAAHSNKHMTMIKYSMPSDMADNWLSRKSYIWSINQE